MSLSKFGYQRHLSVQPSQTNRRIKTLTISSRWAVQSCDCWADNSLTLPVSTSRCFRNITLQSKNPTQDHLISFLTGRHLSAPSVLTPLTNLEPWFPSYGIENWFKVWMLWNSIVQLPVIQKKGSKFTNTLQTQQLLYKWRPIMLFHFILSFSVLFWFLCM